MSALASDSLTSETFFFPHLCQSAHDARVLSRWTLNLQYDLLCVIVGKEMTNSTLNLSLVCARCALTFNRSNGDTTVLDAAPATAPAVRIHANEYNRWVRSVAGNALSAASSGLVALSLTQEC